MFFMYEKHIFTGRLMYHIFKSSTGIYSMWFPQRSTQSHSNRKMANAMALFDRHRRSKCIIRASFSTSGVHWPIIYLWVTYLLCMFRVQRTWNESTDVQFVHVQAYCVGLHLLLFSMYNCTCMFNLSIPLMFIRLI